MGVDNTQLKVKAKRLILQGISQAEVADRLGVSTNTMCTWVKLYGWKEKYETQLRKLNEANLELFADYLKRKDPESFNAVMKHLAAFLLTETPSQSS